jgi:hypothetical protein
VVDDEAARIATWILRLQSSMVNPWPPHDKLVKTQKGLLSQIWETTGTRMGCTPLWLCVQMGYDMQLLRRESLCGAWRCGLEGFEWQMEDAFAGP